MNKISKLLNIPGKVIHSIDPLNFIFDKHAKI